MTEKLETAKGKKNEAGSDLWTSSGLTSSSKLGELGG